MLEMAGVICTCRAMAGVLSAATLDDRKDENGTVFLEVTAMVTAFCVPGVSSGTTTCACVFVEAATVGPPKCRLPKCQHNECDFHNHVRQIHSQIGTLLL